VKALLVTNEFLEALIAELQAAVSNGAHKARVDWIGMAWQPSILKLNPSLRDRAARMRRQALQEAPPSSKPRVSLAVSFVLTGGLSWLAGRAAKSALTGI
jgi:hypothetical protein